MTGRSDFPGEIRRLIEELGDEGFDVVYGKVEPIDTPGFVAERDETVVMVTDRVQTWFVTIETEEDRFDDSWDRPCCVREEVRNRLDASGQR